MTLVLKDPYANSFNIEENWKGHHETDHTDLNGWIWERKYEVDSLCYPLQLAYLLWKETGETSQFDDTFVIATKEILAVLVHVHEFHWVLDGDDVAVAVLIAMANHRGQRGGLIEDRKSVV